MLIVNYNTYKTKSEELISDLNTLSKTDGKFVLQEYKREYYSEDHKLTEVIVDLIYDSSYKTECIIKLNSYIKDTEEFNSDDFYKTFYFMLLKYMLYFKDNRDCQGLFEEPKDLLSIQTLLEYGFRK